MLPADSADYRWAKVSRYFICVLCAFHFVATSRIGEKKNAAKKRMKMTSALAPILKSEIIFVPLEGMYLLIV